MFICVAFESHRELSNGQCVGAPTTTILPITVSIFHSLKCFGHVVYALETSTHQNIAGLLTRPTTYRLFMKAFYQKKLISLYYLIE